MSQELPVQFRGLRKPHVAYTRSVSSSDGSASPDNLSSSNLSSNTSKRISSLPFQLQPPIDNTLNSFMNLELIKIKLGQLTLEYEELSHSHNKFSHKSPSISKTNLLRLSLMKFLRLKNDDFLDFNLFKDISNSQKEKELTKNFINTCKYGTKVLSLWWCTLLDDLQNNWLKFSNIDRSAYLECISRIISRNEWKFVKNMNPMYSSNLIETLDCCFTRLFMMKSLTLPMNAFIGKLFAYCFINLEKFGSILLFLLFVKNHTIKTFIKNHKLIEQTVEPLNTDLLHPCLEKLQRYTGDFYENDGSNVGEKQSIDTKNCMIPPKDSYVSDLYINMKDTNWTKRWATFDSDIFCSFLKHYLCICSEISEVNAYNLHDNHNSTIMPPSRTQIPNQTTRSLLDEMINFPGFIIIYCHVVEIFGSNIMFIKKFKANETKEQQSHNVVNDCTSTNNGPPIHKSYLNFIQKLPIMKILKLLRCLIFERSDSINGNLTLVKLIEGILISKAKSIQIYNPEGCEIIYDIFLRLLLHLQNDEYSYIRSLNWEFWISGLIKMLSTSNMICQSKALSILFNLWNLIPKDYFISSKSSFNSFDLDLDISEEQLDKSWIPNSASSLIFNLSQFLLCKCTWESFFIHWHPLVRHFYYRLLIFKIIGNSNMDNYSNYLNFKEELKRNLSQSFEIFQKNINDMSSLTPIMKIDLLPANPVLNKKLIITPMDSLDGSNQINLLDKFNGSEVLELQSILPLTTSSTSSESSSSTLVLGSTKKIYSYDIFDDAIYSSSIGSVSTTPRSTMSKASTSPSITRSASASALGRSSILSSALNFFKKVNHSQPTIKISSYNQLLRSPSDLYHPTAPSISPSPTVALSPSNMEVNTLGSITELQLPMSSSTQISPDTSRSPSFKLLHNFSSPSPSSSVSEISDEDHNSTYLAIRRARDKCSSKSIGSTNSRVSSVSSMTSLNTNGDAASNGTSTGVTMASLPAPPELLKKIPDVKRFRYKYQLAFSNDSIQLQNRIISNSQRSNGAKMFFSTELGSPKIPIESPSLPFENKPNQLGIGNSYYDLGVGVGEQTYLHTSSEELDEDEDEDEFLMIPRSSLSSRQDTNPQNLEFKGLKNFLILGKSLNEWSLIVEEYEKFIKFTEELNDCNRTNPESNDFAFDTFAMDPLLTASIPLAYKSNSINAYI